MSSYGRAHRAGLPTKTRCSTPWRCWCSIPLPITPPPTPSLISVFGCFGCPGCRPWRGAEGEGEGGGVACLLRHAAHIVTQQQRRLKRAPHAEDLHDASTLRIRLLAESCLDPGIGRELPAIWHGAESRSFFRVWPSFFLSLASNH